jgi:protocatechuate 3,4-dioxygenase alpha subunit
MSASRLTGSQTVGLLTQAETAGEAIRIEGRVVDGDGLPIPDAMIEIWQANAHGRYNHPADTGARELDPEFLGFGRSGTDEDGRYWFETVKPGAVPFDSQQWQAPHICVTIFARGLLNHLVTRLYFADEAANALDLVLNAVPRDRQATLVATREQGEAVVYRFDIVLQGANETAFFNV